MIRHIECIDAVSKRDFVSAKATLDGIGAFGLHGERLWTFGTGNGHIALAHIGFTVGFCGSHGYRIA